MKVLVTLSLIIALCGSKCHSQECGRLGSKFEPNREYLLAMSISSKSTIKLDGDEEFLNKMVDEGYKNPTIMSTLDTVFYHSKTHDINSLNLLPTDICIFNSEQVILKDGVSMMPLIPLMDTINLSGNYDRLNLFTLKKTIGDFEAFKNEKKFNNGFKVGMETLIFEDTCIYIGDEYEKNVAYNMPLPSGEFFRMDLTYVYKLNTILNETLYFDVDLNFSPNLENPETEVLAEGWGTLEFNTKTNQASKAKFYSSLVIKMDMGQHKINNESKIITTYNIAIKE